MNKSQQFVILVQTAAIVKSVMRSSTGIEGIKPSEQATVAVHVAMNVLEADLERGDLTEMCEGLINHIYENAPKPVWLHGLI